MTQERDAPVLVHKKDGGFEALCSCNERRSVYVARDRNVIRCRQAHVHDDRGCCNFVSAPPVEKTDELYDAALAWLRGGEAPQLK